MGQGKWEASGSCKSLGNKGGDTRASKKEGGPADTLMIAR